MADNNKISIDIEINTSGQQQINQFKGAFDNLKTSINNLSSPIAKLNGEVDKLSNTIDGLNKQNNSIGDSVTKVGETYETLKLIFKGVKEAITLLKGGAASLTGVLTGGLSLLIAFGPELWNIVSSFFKGKEAVSQMTDKLKGFNEIMKAANSDTATQTAKLNLLYKSATAVKTSDEERAESIRLLKKEFPGYFDNLNAEDFKNGKANTSYINLTRSIIENARAKAALNKITEESAKVLDAEYKIQKINNAHGQEQEILKEKKRKLQAKASTSGGHLLGGLLAQVDKEIKDSNDRALKSLAETRDIIDTTNKSIKSYTQLGGGANKIAKAASDTQKTDQPDASLNFSIHNTDSRPKEKLRKRGKELDNPKSSGFQPAKDAINAELQQSLDAQKNAKVKNVEKTEEEIRQLRDKYIKESQEKIEETEQAGHHSRAIQEQISLLEVQYTIAIDAAKKKGKDTTDIEAGFAKKKAKLEDDLTSSKVHAGDKFIDAALKNSKKDSAIFKAAFLAKKATSIADTVISTKRAVMESLKAYSGIPFIGQALGIAQAVFMGAQGAASIAEIAKQKPGFAGGGRFTSDGKGALLPGYSRLDDTNAYLRSGEAVVVSEAMRNPWARNLVSAINVAYGGRDFSVTNPSRGYAIGGIFTDGGNSNRYYNQPMNDQQALANSIAYQMVNNFPPIYVDVKDVNNQQNILAQTVNRVNL